MKIDARNLSYKELNEKIKNSKDKEIIVENCYGLRYIGTGAENKKITVFGTAGNATGAYLDKSILRIKGNCQDAVGDTMNEGLIVVEGSSGDATGYAIRGGKIFVRGNVGYRAGIHMKAYKERKPVLIIGEKAGSFLGEYQAGGYIVVLNLSNEKNNLVGNFCGTGMHGGKIFFRTSEPIKIDNPMLVVKKADKNDLEEISEHLLQYCKELDVEKSIINDDYYVIMPNTLNPYKQLYTHN